ncbi:MAG: polyprenyl synthetase family protein [Candidatus Latescibacteria bacterium]|nr:polyprenyl synthetase family protein [Candidatus Latescibacterota bacterium]
MLQIVEHLGPELTLFEQRLEQTLQSDVQLVQEIAKYLMATKGKRLRPALAILSAQVVGELADGVFDAAVAIEMIHTATLIHDDVVDSSTIRRGVASVNSIWDNQISVLMGDFLFSRALALLVKLDSKEALFSLSRATERISKGELFEIEKSQDLTMMEATYFQMIGDKTAALFSAACEIGAVLARGSAEEIAAMTKFGETFGLAFQMTDDLLDFIGDASTLGKPIGNDVRSRKVTLPLIQALTVCGDGKAHDIRDQIEMGIDSDEVWHGIVDFVEDYGGIAYTQKMASQYAASAAETLQQLRPSSARDILYDAVLQTTTRQW